MAGETVFIVDDEEMVGAALRSFLLLETSYHVLTFTSPPAALEALGSEPASVVIADFMMPEMDGIRFLTRCREVRPLASRILLTGYADKENAIRAINEAGLYYYVTKPWDNEQLGIIIRNGIERSTLFSELDAQVAALANANQEMRDLRSRLMRAFV